MTELLEQFGYECYLKDGKERKPFAFSMCRTPRVDDVAIEYDLKKFNKGEAYYYYENVGTDLDYITRCYQLNPEDTTPLYLKREEFYEYLLCGQEFRHLTPNDEEMMVQVDLLDQQKVERNTFRAIRNWKGLMPEERWWLYTTTNASTGGLNDRKGWRTALRYALCENPIYEYSLFDNLDEDTLK